METLEVRIGLSRLDRPMNRDQAARYGQRNMPSDLRAAGFKVSVFRSDRETHGGDWFRVSYGRKS